MSISDLTDDSSANPITDSKMDEKKANDQVTDGPPLDEEVAGDMSEVEEVRKGLHSRHIQMIALAGTIGTGLFLSSGRAISRSGPLGALIGYLVTGAVAGVVTLSIAEMGALVPLNGGIVRYSGYWVDPGLSFANGWNLVYSYSVSMPAEIVAATVLVEFWITINSAIWITIFGVLMLLSGFCVIRIYGEMEFGFSLMKIALIVGVNLMVILSLYTTATGFDESCRHWLSLAVEALTMNPLASNIGRDQGHSYNILALMVRWDSFSEFGLQ